LLPGVLAAQLLSTHDLRVIDGAAREPGNVVFGVNQFELEGFLDDINAYYRRPSVRRTGRNARIRVRAPQAGVFYPAFVIYDSAGRERLALSVAGKLRYESAADWDLNRQRMFFPAEPVSFAGGETIELQALDSSGNYRIESILLLRDRPEARPFTFEFKDIRWFGDSLSWRTNWATACTLQFAGRRIIETESANNHRAALAGLPRGRSYRYRITARTLQGGTTSTGWRELFVGDPPVAAGSARREQIKITAEAEGRPVSAGIPFPRGSLGSEAHIRLLDDAGREVPVQCRPLARWEDGSLKWVLLDFLGSSRAYTLQYGTAVSRRAGAGELKLSDGPEGVTVSTGPIAFHISKKSFGFIEWIESRGARLSASTKRSAFYLTGSDGAVYDTLGPPEEVVIEERGPVRVCVRVRGAHRTADGRRLFHYTVRIHAWAGRSYLRVQHTLENDRVEEEFTSIRSLALRIPLQGTRPQRVELKVRRDTDREAGVVRCGGLTVSVRDFWQNYPKDLVCGPEGLEFGICPRLSADEYAFARGTVDEHRLYYYLRDGRYRFRQGMSKTHEFWLTAGDPAPLPAPAMAAAPAEWYAASGALGHLSRPASGSAYDRAFARGFEQMLERQQTAREFGMLNWGDWWGEREVNWGNCEYDTQHALFLEFVRTGDWRYFRAGERAEWHNRDVDTVHYHRDPHKAGGVWEHKVGHSGDYFPDHADARLRESGDMTPSHTFLEGRYDYYFLTGDARSLETARRTADLYSGPLGRNFDLSSCRQAGWLLIMAVASYRATGDPYYLNFAHMIFERTLELQTEDGGWRRKLSRGHCDCLPRHMGNVGFMVAILMSGLRMYYEVTGDERAAESIVRAARFMVADMWMPEQGTLRYTSCPRSGPSQAGNFLWLDGLTFAFARTGDPRLRGPLRICLDRLYKEIGGFGKSFSQATRQAPRFVDEAEELTRN